MAFLQLPDQNDNPQWGGPNKVGFGDALSLSFPRERETSTTPQLEEYFTSKNHPGGQLSSQQYEESEFKRPGVNFPNGVGTTRAMIAANRFDKSQEYQWRMRDHTTFSHLGSWAGTSAAWFMDPINFLGAYATRGAAEIISQPFISSIAGASTGTKVAARMAAGGLELTAATLPETAVNYETGKHFGENPSMLAAVESLGINAALGGIIHTGVKGLSEHLSSRRGIDYDSHVQALRTATSQLEAGKSPDVSTILKNGAYQMGRIEESTKDIESTDEYREQKQKEIMKGEKSDDFHVGSSYEPGKADEEILQSLKDTKEEIAKNTEIDDVDREEVSKELDESIENLENKAIGKETKLPDTLPELDEDKYLEKYSDKTSGLMTSAKQLLRSNIARNSLDILDRSPLNKEEINAAVDKMKASDGDIDGNPAETEEFKRRVEEADPIELEDARKNAISVRDTLPKEVKEHLDEILKHEKDNAEVNNAISRYAKCIAELGLGEL